MGYNECNPSLMVNHLNKCQNYTLIGIFMMRDPIRLRTKETVYQMQSNQVEVVMITGDNVHTAKSVAMELNMISEQSNQYEVMEANRFRQLLGVLNDEPTNL